jgi:hypothetical protein
MEMQATSRIARHPIRLSISTIGYRDRSKNHQNQNTMKEEQGGGRYTQLCVLQGISDSIEDLKGLLHEQFEGMSFLMANEYETKDGRRDVLFYVNDKDISRFAVQRFAVGIRWWEDVLGNKKNGVPKAMKELYPNTWSNTGRLSTYR